MGINVNSTDSTYVQQPQPVQQQKKVDYPRLDPMKKAFIAQYDPYGRGIYHGSIISKIVNDAVQYAFQVGMITPVDIDLYNREIMMTSSKGVTPFRNLVNVTFNQQ